MGRKFEKYHGIWLLPGRATVPSKLVVIYLGLHNSLAASPRFGHFLCKKPHPLIVRIGKRGANVAPESIIVFATNDWDDKYLFHGPFKRSRISLLARKWGCRFSSIKTGAPSRGLRPTRDGLSFTENEPKPRSSTRRPSTRDAKMASSTVATILSASRTERT